MFSRRLLLFPCLAALLQNVSATCYFPNGNISPADVACISSAADSFCCFNTQACLSNGICMTGVVNGVEQYARGTCTDQNWESAACPKFCINQRNSGNVMYSCNSTTVDSYCCNDGCSCSSNAGQQEVVQFTGSPYTITEIGQTSTFPNPSATASSHQTSSASSSTASSSTASSSIVSSTSSVTSSATSAGETSSSTPTPVASKHSNSTALGVGIGVGLGGAIILAALGAFFVLRRRARSRRSAPFQSGKDTAVLPSYSDTLKPHTASAATEEPYLTSRNSSTLNELESGERHLSELGTGREHLPSKSGVGELPSP